MILYDQMWRLEVCEQLKIVEYNHAKLSISGHRDRQLIFSGFGLYFQRSVRNSPELRQKCLDLLIAADNDCFNSNSPSVFGFGAPRPEIPGYYEKELALYAKDDDITEYEYLSLCSLLKERFNSVATNKFIPEDKCYFQTNAKKEYSGCFTLAQSLISNNKVPIEVAGKVLRDLFDIVIIENSEYIKLMKHPQRVTFMGIGSDPTNENFNRSEICNNFVSLTKAFIGREIKSNTENDYRKELMMEWLNAIQESEFGLPVIVDALRKSFLISSHAKPSERHVSPPNASLSAKPFFDETLIDAYRENSDLKGVEEISMYCQGMLDKDTYGDEQLFSACCNALIGAHNRIGQMSFEDTYYIAPGFDPAIDEFCEENMSPTLLMALNIEEVLTTLMPSIFEKDSLYEAGLLSLFEASEKSESIRNFINSHVDDIVVCEEFILNIIGKYFSAKHVRCLMRNMPILSEEFLNKVVSLYQDISTNVNNTKGAQSFNNWMPLSEAYESLAMIYYYPALLNGRHVSIDKLGALLTYFTDVGRLSLADIKLLSKSDLKSICSSVSDRLPELLPKHPIINELITSELLFCKAADALNEVELASATKPRML